MNELIPLLWLRAVLPAAVCAAILFAPALFQGRPRLVADAG